MPWKFVCNHWFHNVLQTTIVRQITKYIHSYLMRINLFTINHLFAHSLMFSRIALDH